MSIFETVDPHEILALSIRYMSQVEHQVSSAATRRQGGGLYREDLNVNGLECFFHSEGFFSVYFQTPQQCISI